MRTGMNQMKINKERFPAQTQLLSKKSNRETTLYILVTKKGLQKYILYILITFKVSQQLHGQLQAGYWPESCETSRRMGLYSFGE
jgi:hypothetical protein